MRVGYARVSSDDQKLDLQLDALRKAGCKKILEDRKSGARADRPGLIRLLEIVREGDVVIVWRLDRLGRSLRDLLDLTARFETEGVGLKSLQENIDTTSSGGRLIFQIFGALSEFERNIIRERTQAGLAAARSRGRTGGRPKSLGPKEQRVLVRLYRAREHSIAELCRIFHISKPTLYSYLEAADG
jgi:DNA invertase Pin-like site-specific DNA recombinase